VRNFTLVRKFGGRKMRKSRKTPQQSGEPVEPTSHNQLLNLSEKDATLQDSIPRKSNVKQLKC